MTMIPNPVGNPADPEGGGKSPQVSDTPTVGAGDRAADEARSKGESLPGDAPTDSDGVPVGSADADADAAASGGERPRP